MPAVLSRALAVFLVAGIAVALYAAMFLVSTAAADRADAACRGLVHGDGSYTVTLIWRGGIAWDCEYGTAWNPRGTVVFTPADLLRVE
jgi:hypothetical protein